MSGILKPGEGESNLVSIRDSLGGILGTAKDAGSAVVTKVEEVVSDAGSAVKAAALGAAGLVSQLWQSLKGAVANPLPSGPSPALKEGDRGEAVVELQTLITKAGVSLKADGIFGPMTKAALQRVQKAKGLPASGIADAPTWEALRTSAKATSSPPQTGGILGEGSKGPEVAQIQAMITKAGISIKADGIWGPMTTAALKRFQTSEGLTPSGRADAPTLDRLNAYGTRPSATPATATGRPTLRLGSSGEYVSALQALLNDAGHTLKADGLFGPMTDKAVRAFQSRMGLTVDGIVGPKTWAALEGQRSEAPPRQPVPQDNALIRQVEQQLPAALTGANYERVTRLQAADVSFVDQAIAAAMRALPVLNYFANIKANLPRILQAIAYHESTFKPGAVGTSGEVTPWQFLPSVITNLRSKYNLPPLDPGSPGSVGAYLAAYIRDIDSFVGKFFPKTNGIPTPTSAAVAQAFAKLSPATAAMGEAAVLNGWWLNGNDEKLWNHPDRLALLLTRLASAGLNIARLL